jgi:hypothetical protein
MVSILLMECACLGLSHCPDTVPILRGEGGGEAGIHVLPGQIIGLSYIEEFQYVVGSNTKEPTCFSICDKSEEKGT